MTPGHNKKEYIKYVVLRPQMSKLLRDSAIGMLSVVTFLRAVAYELNVYFTILSDNVEVHSTGLTIPDVL